MFSKWTFRQLFTRLCLVLLTVLNLTITNNRRIFLTLTKILGTWNILTGLGDGQIIFKYKQFSTERKWWQFELLTIITVCSSQNWRTVTAVFDILEMTSSSSPPTPSVDLDTIDTSLSDITVWENVLSSNRSSRNLDDSVEPIPDLIPRTFYKKFNKNTQKDFEIRENGTKKMETIILLSMLVATVVGLYLFPQE